VQIGSEQVVESLFLVAYTDFGLDYLHNCRLVLKVIFRGENALKVKEKKKRREGDIETPSRTL
jgi:hypothetical protein